MRVLVTGAGGYVGRHLVERLTSDGFEIRAHIRTVPSPAPWSIQPADIATGDLNNREAVETMVQGVDAVVHCAARLHAESIDHFRKDNVNVTEELAKAARAAQVSRFVHLSSIAVYGLKEHRKTTEKAPMAPGKDGYAITKAEAEERLATVPDLQTVMLRPGFVWGGPHDSRFLGKVSRMVRKGRFVYPGPCQTPLPFSHVDNVTDAVVLALTTPAAAGHRLNITDDLSLSMREFIAALADSMELRPPRWSVPQGLASKGMAALHHLSNWLPFAQSLSFRSDAIALLNTECTFSNEAAKDVLQYAPTPREHLVGRLSKSSPS